MTKHPDQAQLAPVDETEVRLKPQRRPFTAAYKAQIVAECDAAAAQGEGQVGAILRREGLYSSHLSKWRQASASGLTPKKPGRPKKSESDKALERERDQLRRKNQQLEEELRRAQLIIEAQKKLSELLANLGQPKSDDSE
jgi:transposase-like protein